MGRSDIMREEGWAEANGGSGRKSALTRVGWLHGQLPAKREKAAGEIASPTHSAYILKKISMSAKRPEDAFKNVFFVHE